MQRIRHATRHIQNHRYPSPRSAPAGALCIRRPYHDNSNRSYTESFWAAIALDRVSQAKSALKQMQNAIIQISGHWPISADILPLVLSLGMGQQILCVSGKRHMMKFNHTTWRRQGTGSTILWNHPYSAEISDHLRHQSQVRYLHRIQQLIGNMHKAPGCNNHLKNSASYAVGWKCSVSFELQECFSARA